jgi:hypothetical protein
MPLEGIPKAVSPVLGGVGVSPLTPTHSPEYRGDGSLAEDFATALKDLTALLGRVLPP